MKLTFSTNKEEYFIKLAEMCFLTLLEKYDSMAILK